MALWALISVYFYISSIEKKTMNILRLSLQKSGHHLIEAYQMLNKFRFTFELKPLLIISPMT